MFSLSFWPLHWTLCLAHIVGTEIMINKLNQTCFALFFFVKSLEKDTLPWSVSSGTLKSYSWNNVLKENIQPFSVGQNTLCQSGGTVTELLCPQDCTKTQAHGVGDQLRFILLASKEKKIPLTCRQVITFTSHEELIDYISNVNTENIILIEMLQ